eukprot:TRINITY_DN2935_c0_g1_i1.p2 TRINITY_DN2935_c0_g1~~TRINITY_DN2935_c0_g1_i1.p2  ORF type:complete len:71 (-),score=4.76 TRINITY_DN2935_c0_g1_i1:157-369(-)
MTSPSIGSALGTTKRDPRLTELPEVTLTSKSTFHPPATRDNSLYKKTRTKKLGQGIGFGKLFLPFDSPSR